jgi:hypothetical protein
VSDFPNLTESIAESYARHPLFQSPLADLRLPAALLDPFNAYYRLLTSHGEQLRGAIHAATRAECLRTLDAIFDNLHVQTTDGPLRDFLRELRSECRRVALVGIDFARHGSRAGFAGLHPDTPGHLRSLERDRCFLGRLPARHCDEIRTLSTQRVARFRERAAAGNLTREDLSDNRGAVIKALTACLNDGFREMGILDAVSLYSGRPMTVSGLALELSVPQATWWRNAFPALERPPHTLYAHLDESVDHPKSIVYVSDVEASNGPTGYYPRAYDSLVLNPLQDLVSRVVGNVGNGAGSPLRPYYAKPYHQSMCSEPFRAHYMSLPPAMRFNSHLGWDLLPDSGAERQLVAREVRMTGPAGTFIVFDGARLLHRGGLVERGERIALQVIFSDARLSRRLAQRLKRVN